MLRVSRRIIAGLVVGSFTTVYAATDCTKVTEIPVSECQSLLELYNNTGGANWTEKTGWNETNTPCSWAGITCGSGNVTNVWIYSNKLIGNLPNLNLPKLTFLNLSYNKLSGNVPDFNLPNLETLVLTSNQLSGSIPNFNLPKLTSLDFSSNQLSGSIPNFSNLANLTSLNLNGNQLSGNVPNFSNLANLTSLNLSANQLSENIPNFSNLANLTTLNLGYNKLTGSVPNFSNFPKLLELALHVNQLRGSIPNFSNLPSLTTLSLQLNQLSGVIPNFSNLPKLGSLTLNLNQLSGTIPNLNWTRLSLPQFTENCGLTALNSTQETILNEISSFWKNQNANCSNAVVCPVVTLDPTTLDLQLPNLNYNNASLSANLKFVQRDGKIMFEVVNYSGNSTNCPSANLSSDFKLHIPTLTLGTSKLWADLQLYQNPTNDGKILFELVKYGNT